MQRCSVARCLLTLVMMFPLLATAAEDIHWSDGSPLVRFDKDEAVQMEQVADWEGWPERHWAGPALWLNRLQDWSVRDGVLVCEPERNLPARTAHLITHELSDVHEPFRLEVTITLAKGSAQAGFAGFLIGAGEGRLDHRGAAMIHHSPGKGGGLLAVVNTSDEGSLAFREMSSPEAGFAFPELEGQQTVASAPIRLDYHRMRLNLEGLPAADGTYALRLSVWSDHAGELLGAQEVQGVPADRLLGNVGLVSHVAGQPVRHAFEAFKVGGERLASHPDRAFGPIAGTLYSLSGSTLKLGAQFMHIGEALGPKRARLRARLEARPLVDSPSDDGWQVVDGPKALSPPDYYLLFRSDTWDATQDWETRVVFKDADGTVHTYRTVVRANPVEQDVLSLAGFTGMGVMGRVAHAGAPKLREEQMLVGRWTPANVWMPFNEAVQAVAKQDVDILFFTGDQIYEGKPSPKDPSRMPYNDYLYKWLLWHWSFRELTNHLPALVQPDDHDVYHGNLWGWGGRVCLTNRNNDGGYLCSPYFVNMVHRTQTAHNPDAYDPTPALNGISNYYNSFVYGGVGFAVLEDRKFKTPAHIENPEQQRQLGERQLEFLTQWGQDWEGQTFKTVVSQTIYAAMHVNFAGKLSRDADTNGFPKVGRDRSVERFRRCGAFVLSGDQHLSTFARLGIDAPSDAVYQFCVPALANIFWRWFYPGVPEESQAAPGPSHLGEFTDAWGNYFRMIAVANPERQELLGQKLRQRHVIPAAEAMEGKGDAQRTCLGDGYGIVRFDKQSHQITVECWPHNVDPERGGEPFPGWPITLGRDALDGRQPVAWLPDLQIEGSSDPVVQIIDETTGEVIKTARVGRDTHSPGVFDANHTYTLRVGDPDLGVDWWERNGLAPASESGGTALRVVLAP